MQGGDIDKLELASVMKPVYASEEGRLKDISAHEIGRLVLELGGGRKKKGDAIDYGVGIVINKHIDDNIVKGDILCYLYQNDELDRTDDVLKAFTIVK